MNEPLSVEQLLATVEEMRDFQASCYRRLKRIEAVLAARNEAKR